MEKHHRLLEESLDQCVLALHELMTARANDPVFSSLARKLWIVRHAIDAARYATIETRAELARLKDQGVKL